MTPEIMKDVAERLAEFKHPSCEEAARTVFRAIENAERFENSKAEQALCHAVWGHLDSALHETPDGETWRRMNALRAEMIGRVLLSRMELGWLIRAPGSPEDLPKISDFGL
jgi:tRNA-dihydrouridine synthase